jgi:protein-L-isoaspartate O-methyltransferase
MRKLETQIRKYMKEEGIASMSLLGVWKEIEKRGSRAFAEGLNNYLMQTDNSCSETELFYGRMAEKVSGISCYDLFKCGNFKKAVWNLQNAIEMIGIEPGTKVLDVGCGTGLEACFIAELVGNKGEVLGIDSCKPMIERANERETKRKLSNVRFESMCMDGPTLTQGYFDSAICLDSMLEGINKDYPHAEIIIGATLENALEHLRNALRDGAKLAVSLTLQGMPYAIDSCVEENRDRFDYAFEKTGFHSPIFSTHKPGKSLNIVYFMASATAGKKKAEEKKWSV